jgi:hypothetical protein
MGTCSLCAGEGLNYAGNVDFLKKHTTVIELKSGDAAVVLAPAWQGRVMTSSTQGAGGYSFGWINYKLIEQGILPAEKAKGRLEEHIYVFGGEERFWLGPEGGQFGIFFPKGAAFEFSSWKTPAPLDTEGFDVVSSSDIQAVLRKSFKVANHSGTEFQLEAQRTVRLLSPAEIQSITGAPLAAGTRAVAYETINTITNRGNTAWTPENGLLSIWMLGMYKPSPQTVVAIPFRQGGESTLGPVVNDAYFGKVPADRLKVAGGVIFFKGDGAQRGKIGLSPQRSLGVAGSYSAEQNALTLTFYPHPDGQTRYVNSAWEIQENPYEGDVINSYNDGSPEPGKPPLGPFYELETSSPAAALKPGESITHRQTTLHLTGDPAALDPIALKHLRTTTGGISAAFTADE